MSKVSPDRLAKSGKVNMFSALGWPILFGMAVLLLLGGSAFAILHVYSQIATLSFASVFTETAVEPFEKQILEETNRDEVLSAYKKTLPPDKPFPPHRVFCAFSLPLESYCGGRTPKAFECRVTNAWQGCEMRARLFLRSETNGTPVYQILASSKPFQFSVPASRKGARLIAIGLIELPKEIENLDLNKVIGLEVAK